MKETLEKFLEASSKMRKEGVCPLCGDVPEDMQDHYKEHDRELSTPTP